MLQRQSKTTSMHSSLNTGCTTYIMGHCKSQMVLATLKLIIYETVK